jgi:hypothetical protein
MKSVLIGAMVNNPRLFQQPETVIQRVFIALNSQKTNNNKDDTAVPMETVPRQSAVDAYVEKCTEGFTASPSMPRPNTSELRSIFVFWSLMPQAVWGRTL